MKDSIVVFPIGKFENGTIQLGIVTSNIELLKNNKYEYDKDMFNDYWMYYLTTDMARMAELPKPYYRNLSEYKQFKNIYYLIFNENLSSLIIIPTH